MDPKNAGPGFFQKREMLNAEQASKDALSHQGRKFLESGLFDEAISCFEKAGDEKGIEEVLEQSRVSGDTFSFEAALRASGRSASRQEWEQLGELALEKGKLWFSYRAFEKADNQAGLERVREAMAEVGISAGSR